MTGLTIETLTGIDGDHFHDEGHAWKLVERESWPTGPVCAYCGRQERVGKAGERGNSKTVYKCYDCLRQFTVTVGTVFHATKLPLHQWLTATAALNRAKDYVSSERLGELLGVQQKTAYRLARIIAPARVRAWRTTPRRELVCYPFLDHYRDDSGHELLRQIQDAVPRNIPEDRRADICQELAVSILSGEIEVTEAKTEAMRLFHKVYALHPTIYGPLSLDAPAPGREDGRFGDLISEETSIWNQT